MGQFTVHRNPNARTRTDIPFLLDMQADLFSILATRVVVPLYRLEALGSTPMAKLTPVLRFQDQNLVAMVPELAGVARRSLGPAVGDLVPARSELLQAMDLLLTGF
jgi:toxin CcdB